MRIIRIFQDGDYALSDRVLLSARAAHHVAVVLRMKPGEKLVLFSGNDQEFDAEIVELSSKKVWVQILTAKKISRESSQNIHLVQALSKQDSFEWLLQKSVELGVNSITPVIADHSVVRWEGPRLEKKMQQWQGIIIGACEQCGRNVVPVLHAPRTLSAYIADPMRSAVFYALIPQVAFTWKTYIADVAENKVLFVGPEGGWSAAEIKAFECFGAKPLSLGPRILRTETAALVGISLFQALFED
ncbi:MAG: 16S rRNA (uracil(1498)-N(3))-methyltransferase [Legionellaceae bacterium]|nr:16S rRNA (uracil(1498)-N(3))-methyltransferase [Legionellaceae bacterium]